MGLIELFFFTLFNKGSFSYISDKKVVSIGIKATEYFLKIFVGREVAWIRQSDPISVFELQMKDVC